MRIVISNCLLPSSQVLLFSDCSVPSLDLQMDPVVQVGLSGRTAYTKPVVNHVSLRKTSWNNTSNRKGSCLFWINLLLLDTKYCIPSLIWISAINKGMLFHEKAAFKNPANFYVIYTIQTSINSIVWNTKLWNSFIFPTLCKRACDFIQPLEKEVFQSRSMWTHLFHGFVLNFLTYRSCRLGGPRLGFVCVCISEIRNSKKVSLLFLSSFVQM